MLLKRGHEFSDEFIHSLEKAAKKFAKKYQYAAVVIRLPGQVAPSQVPFVEAVFKLDVYEKIKPFHQIVEQTCEEYGKSNPTFRYDILSQRLEEIEIITEFYGTHSSIELVIEKDLRVSFTQKGKEKQTYTSAEDVRQAIIETYDSVIRENRLQVLVDPPKKKAKFTKH